MTNSLNGTNLYFLQQQRTEFNIGLSNIVNEQGVDMTNSSGYELYKSKVHT